MPVGQWLGEHDGRAEQMKLSNATVVAGAGSVMSSTSVFVPECCELTVCVGAYSPALTMYGVPFSPDRARR